ncbi:MAG TPA: sugar ABC transporter ATP-binding protein [Candidatus Blautia faecipullorum]|nr:sugar ABC transporter ATP-binding protein [Candidatus Blautia faecipullorum]
MENNVVLEMRDISKNFTGVRALSHVDFTLRKGEIHALMGENGAGKSTLIKVLTGVHEFESGTIRMAGKDKNVINHSPQEAQENGISTVYQEVNLCPNLTVAENLFIGREPRKMGMINWKEMNERSGKLLQSLDINVPPTQMLDECSVAIQQMIAIARAVDMKCQVLILDEPTSSLDDDEVEKLFVLMRRLRDEGVGIIFVTHFLEQVYAVCDRITVLRNGELVGEYETKELPRVMLVAKMMGKDFDDLADIKSAHAGKKAADAAPVIEAKGLGHRGTIKPFDITINKGEVIGLTGLLGSGRSELVRAIYGADKADTGTLKVNGKEAKINSPLEAMKLGMAYLPEDRKAEGIIADLSVRENIIIALQAKKGMFHPLSRKEMEEAADKYIEMLQIKTASRETPIKSLSGGNQQKVILGRWLLTNPEYLILDEPTRGIDIGTKTEIQKIVLDLADQGMAVTFISSEVEEMLRTCSRMAVLRDGEKVGELNEEELSQSNIMKAIAGGDDKNE